MFFINVDRLKTSFVSIFFKVLFYIVAFSILTIVEEICRENMKRET